MEYITFYVTYTFSEKLVKNWIFSSAIRGCFGRNIRRTHCLQRNTLCSDCVFSDCLFRILFEQDSKGHENFRPYIIFHQETYEFSIIVKFTVFQPALQKIQSILHSVLLMNGCEISVAGTRNQIKSLSVTDQYGNDIYNHETGIISEPDIAVFRNEFWNSNDCVLEFLSPLRIKYHKKLMREFHWEAFIRNLLSRYRHYSNSCTEADMTEFPSILPPETKVSSEMRWKDTTRKSWVQNQKMKFGGLIGQVFIEDVPEELQTLLKAGEIIHVGKQTTFGLGKYKVIQVSPANQK